MAKNNNQSDESIDTNTLAESENFIAWTSVEPDGEIAYHIELGTITLHFFKEEWDELLSLMDEVISKQ